MVNISEKLYNILSTTFNGTVKTLTADGKETLQMDEVRLFSFDFVSNRTNYGPVVILLSANDNLEVYYGDNTSKVLATDARRKWEKFIEHMSTFARGNRYGFSLKHLSNLRYDLANIANITESFKVIFESYYGSKKTSYNKQGNAKIIIRHSKQIEEGDARFRNISSVYIENANGERFKLPFTKLAGAKAMARHVSEGGNPYDVFGVHISETVRDINTLGGFLRRTPIVEDDEVHDLIESSRSHYNSLRSNLKKIAGKRGYATYKDGWTPADMSESAASTARIRELFTDRYVDSQLDEALPIIARLQELENPTVEPAMKEVAAFNEWAESVVEETQTTLSKKQQRLLADFLEDKQPVGIDALNVTEQLVSIFYDKRLFARLATLAEKNPDADARPLVKRWIARHA